MSPESYENESKEMIDQCLNCTLPEYMCHGRGNCDVAIRNNVGRRKKGQLELEITELTKAGYNSSVIARKLGLEIKSVHVVFHRLIKKGILTREEIQKANRIDLGD